MPYSRSLSQIRPYILIHTVLLASIFIGLANRRVAIAADSVVSLNGRVVDADSKEPMAARIYIQSADGKWFFVGPAKQSGTADEKAKAVEYKRQVGTKSVEMFVSMSAHPFSVAVPPGEYVVRIERGKEYVPWEKTVSVGSNGLDLTIPLRRWINMADQKWFSGDTHSHLPLQDVLTAVVAEDLNIAFPLSYWVTTADAGPIKGNRVKTGEVSAKPIEVAKKHLVYPLNTEYELFTVKGKSHTLGAFVAIGQTEPFDDAAPPVKPIAERMHAQGALIDLEKHSWPWSVMIVPVMKADLFELANNHVWRTEFGFPKWTVDAAGQYMRLEMEQGGFTERGWIDFGFQTYYALLNCGFQLKPTAGTASGVHPVPLGFGRVYVHQAEGFDYKKWLAALGRGESFVSNGPLCDIRFADQLPGHSLGTLSRGQSIRVKGNAYGLSPIDRVEYLVNGQVVRTSKPTSRARANGGFECDIDESIPIEQSGWLAVRLFESKPEGRIRFAHTSPVHFIVDGTQLLPTKDQIEYLVGRVEQELARNQEVLSPESLAEYREALAVYHGIAAKVQQHAKGQTK